MKRNITKLFAAFAASAVCAAPAFAETLSEEYSLDFSTMEVGFLMNSFWGGQNPGMAVVASPDGEGNALYMSGESNPGELTEEGFKTWSTLARYPGFTLPSGYNLSNVTMIEAVYMPTQADGIHFGIQLRNPDSALFNCDEDPVVNEWNTAVFDGQGFTNNDGDLLNSNASSFDLCVGCFGSTEYYVKSVTFYLEKEVTQREKDEAALDKATAACVEVNFDNWETSFNEAGEFVSSTHLGSNGYGTNRQDMIIDKGPEGYNNNCAHVVYGGWTNMFLADVIAIPEGYTFDDLRLVEYDLYETELTGVNCTNGEEFAGKNGTPILKLKSYYNWGAYEPIGAGATAVTGTTEVNKWNHVEFRPSTFSWSARDFEETVLDGEGNPVLDEEGNEVKNSIHWDAAQTEEEFNKVTSFAMSVGFMPCQNQIYVDNVKLWFQKSGETDAVEGVAAAKVSNAVYNLQGIRVMEAADKADLQSLPAGLYIFGGKKIVVK